MPISTIPTREDILSSLADTKDKLRAYGVRRLGLFGSFVRGEQRAESDIDLLVEFEPGQKTFDNFMGLSFFLDERLNRRVELVTRESLSPYLAPRILQEVEEMNIID